MVCGPWDGSVAPFCFSTIWYSARWGGNLPLWTRGAGTEAFGVSYRVRLAALCFLKGGTEKKPPWNNRTTKSPKINRLFWNTPVCSCCVIKKEIIGWQMWVVDHAILSLYCSRGEIIYQQDLSQFDVRFLYPPSQLDRNIWHFSGTELMEEKKLLLKLSDSYHPNTLTRRNYCEDSSGSKGTYLPLLTSTICPASVFRSNTELNVKQVDSFSLFFVEKITSFHSECYANVLLAHL